MGPGFDRVKQRLVEPQRDRDPHSSLEIRAGFFLFRIRNKSDYSFEICDKKQN